MAKSFVTTPLKVKSDLVVLYSGGADSTLLIEIANKIGKTPYCVLIDYGQLHKEELKFAEEQCVKRNLEYRKITISGYNVDSGLTGSGEKGMYEGVSIYNVPARNSIFLSIACGVAESLNIKTVWIGCDMSDYYGHFPDCKQEYIGKVNDVFSIAFSYPIQVEAPLLGLTKEMVVHLLQSFGVNEKELYSGYGEYA